MRGVLVVLEEELEKRCRIIRAHFAEHTDFFTRQFFVCLDRIKIPPDFRFEFLEQKSEREGLELYYFSSHDGIIRLTQMSTKYLCFLVVELAVFNSF